MAAQDGLTFEGTFNSVSTGKFKDNTSNAIIELFMRELVTAIKESYLNRIDDMIDENDMASDSATMVPTQQSVKAFVENAIYGAVKLKVADAATTANITLSGTQTIDGESGFVNMVVLVKDQTDQTENGPYLMQSGAWTRLPGATTGGNFHGMMVVVQKGTANADTLWIQETDDVTVGSSNIVFGEFSGSSAFADITGDADDNASLVAYVAAQILAAIEGLKWKDSVAVATTANITLSGVQTIDGQAGAVNLRTLVKNQSTQSENGIYLQQTGAWVRSTDANAAAELECATVTVQTGSSNANTTWTQTTDGITLGSSNIVWTQFGTSVPNADATTAGIAKLYTSIGGNTDGSVTQAAIQTALALKLNLAGGTMGGNIAMAGNKITGAANGTALSDYATVGQLAASNILFMYYNVY